VLKEGIEKERSKEDPKYQKVQPTAVRSIGRRRGIYGVGFNGLYLNLRGRELDNPLTKDEDESGIVEPGAAADALLRQIKAELEAEIDPQNGKHPVLRCDLAKDVYSGARIAEAPDMLVGYDSGYGNSDASATGRIPHDVLIDNKPANHGGKLGTFNGNHLMHPDVVPGTLLSNRRLREGSFGLEDLTAEILHTYGIEKPVEMKGSPVFEAQKQPK
jgi:predicted AlkP superfamily phosphohydrolase/phosphomutase